MNPVTSKKRRLYFGLLRNRWKCSEEVNHVPCSSEWSSRGGSRIFFRRGCTRLLLYFNTNKPHSSFFFAEYQCIRKPQVILGRGAHPLHPPPRSAPVQRVPCFQKGTLNIVVSQNSSHLNSGPIRFCGTPACSGNAPNRLGKTPKKQTASTKENNSL